MTEEKFSDAGQVHLLTGVCPTIALHVLWDCPDGLQSSDEIRKLADRHGVRPGSINPNLFQGQEYKYGSFGNPDPAVRRRALQHTKDSIEIARRLHSRDVSMWFADGSNYPGTANIRQRKQWFQELLKESHAELSPGQRLLIEYKPFEPAFLPHRYCRLESNGVGHSPQCLPSVTVNMNVDNTNYMGYPSGASRWPAHEA